MFVLKTFKLLVKVRSLNTNSLASTQERVNETMIF